MEALIGRPRTVTDSDALAAARSAIVEHGPAVSLATLARAVGLSPPALIKRFGSKEQLVFRALLPSTPPRWWAALEQPPGADAHAVLTDVLDELCTSFEEVGPALAALRMSSIDVTRVFPSDRVPPSRQVRHVLARWLEDAGVPRAHTVADAAVGAAEARGLLTWVGAHLVDGDDHHPWAQRLASHILADTQ